MGNERRQHRVALFGRNLSPKPSHNSGNLPLDCLFSVSVCSPTVRRGGRESGLESHDVKYVCPGASPPPRTVGRFRPWHLDTPSAPSPHSCLLSGSWGDRRVTGKTKDWSPVESPNTKLIFIILQCFINALQANTIQATEYKTLAVFNSPCPACLSHPTALRARCRFLTSRIDLCCYSRNRKLMQSVIFLY